MFQCRNVSACEAIRLSGFSITALAGVPGSLCLRARSLRMPLFFKHAGAAVTLAVTALLSDSALAAAIDIDATTPGSITFSACDFESGMAINGSAMGVCNKGAGGTVTLAASSINFSGNWVTPGSQADTGPLSVYFTSASDPTSYVSLLSYAITDGSGGSAIVGSFTTGFSNILGSVPAGAVTATAGIPFGFNYAFLTANVTASGAAVSAPATVGLLGLALAMSGMTRRRRV
jgi:hypothetical protein